MWHSKEQLRKCEALTRAGAPCRFEIGDTVGRSYADVGGEEFSVLPGDKLLSIYRGTISELQPLHRNFFYWVPSADELLDFLTTRGVQISTILYPEGRAAEVYVGEKVFRAKTLIDALLDCAIDALQEKPKKSIPTPPSKEKISELILASTSPRRKDLLRDAGYVFRVEGSSADETILANENAREMVERLSVLKAKTVAQKFPDALVIGADTTVLCDGQILAKPEDAADARRMLKMLSGKEHIVWSAFSLLHESSGYQVTRSNFSAVKVKKLSDSEIEDYIASGEPFDKAGAYAIQGLASNYVERFTGLISIVVAFDLQHLYQELAAVGIFPEWRKSR